MRGKIPKAGTREGHEAPGGGQNDHHGSQIGLGQNEGRWDPGARRSDAPCPKNCRAPPPDAGSDCGPGRSGVKTWPVPRAESSRAQPQSNEGTHLLHARPGAPPAIGPRRRDRPGAQGAANGPRAGSVRRGKRAWTLPRRCRGEGKRHWRRRSARKRSLGKRRSPALRPGRAKSATGPWRSIRSAEPSCASPRRSASSATAASKTSPRCSKERN